MKTYIAVAVGGVIGALLRYGMTVIFTLLGWTHFPWATLVVNMSGAFLLTFLLFHPKIKARLDETVFIGITVGLIGAYTTFSAITLEIVMLVEEQVLLAVIYLVITIGFGLISSFLGYKVASKGVLKQ